MTALQAFYVIWVFGVFALWKPTLTAWVVLANMATTLAVCLAMDLGKASRDQATSLMMVIDLASGTALIFRPGLSRVMGATFGVTALLHTLNLAFGVSIGATFAVVYAVNAVQLGVLAIGSGGNTRLRRRFGLGDTAGRGVSSPRNTGLGATSVAEISAGNRVQE